jgi:type VI protein secretion system component VasK
MLSAPYVNQDPVPFPLADDWTSQHDAELTVSVRAANTAASSTFVSAPRSYWALLRLLSALSLARASDAGCTLTWMVAGTSSQARVRVVREPFAAFDLLGAQTGHCAWVGGAR